MGDGRKVAGEDGVANRGPGYDVQGVSIFGASGWERGMGGHRRNDDSIGGFTPQD